MLPAVTVVTTQLYVYLCVCACVRSAAEVESNESLSDSEEESEEVNFVPLMNNNYYNRSTQRVQTSIKATPVRCGAG